MRKQIALGAALGFGFLLTAAGGCGKVTDDGALDAGAVATADGQVWPVFDGNCCPPPRWDVACFDPTSVLTYTTPPLAPAANQGKCASDDVIAQFYAACVAVAADAGPDASGDAGETCDAFIAANAACALCLGGYSDPEAGPPPSSPWPALLQIDQAGHTIPNVAACLAAISTGTDMCKSNYANDDLCLESGCDACSATDFSACATTQSTDPTSTCLTNNPLDHDCQAALNAISQSDADSKCGASTQIQSQADFETVFTLVAKTMCE
jgi:hypothetical protein